MSVDLKNTSIAHWFRDTEKHRCGYCKNESGSISNGMWAESLTVQDYQDLIDRGWRRSGKYCYKPIMSETCCPQYTIKCDTSKFSLSKSQKKVIKKFNKYLDDGVLNKNYISETNHEEGHDSSVIFMKDCPNINFSKISNSDVRMDVVDPSQPNTSKPHHSKYKEKLHDKSEDRNNIEGNYNVKTTAMKGVGADTSKPPCKKAKLLRLERKKEKLIKRGLTLEKKEPVQTQKTVEQYFEEVLPNSKHKLRIELIATSEPGDAWEQVKEVEFELYKKYQVIVHNDPPTKFSMKGFCRFLVNSPLKVTIEQISKKHNSFTTSAKLFQKYQMNVHNDPIDECTEGQFLSFLVETPLKHIEFPNCVDGPGYGSFHQQYWIDDQLVAVGVIDILPKCVSSVYFFYDPDYRNLTLGTYGALWEVQLTRSLQKTLPELSEYYMGFYIHSCQKMRYKGKLIPSYLLCPETYHWIPIQKCIEKLDANKYSRLEDDIDGFDENLPSSREIGEIKVVFDYKLMYVKDYKRFHKEQEIFNEIGRLVGNKCAKNIVFWIN